MNERDDHIPMTGEELNDLRKRIDDCRRRILAEFGIEWKPEGGGDANQR